MDQIDKLLASLKPKPDSPEIPQAPPATTVQQANRSIDDLLQALDEAARQKVRDTLKPASSPPIPKTLTEQREQVTDELIAPAAEQQQVLRYQQRQVALQEQRYQDLQDHAQHWLQTLDRHSVEGRWFDEFACHYESKLEAAIEYFVALQEINSPLPTNPK
jgi:hypothetical protein